MYYDKLTDLGIKLTRRHGQEKTLCPKCSAGRKNKTDKCLSVNITTGEYNCKNSCGFVGNVRSYERPHNPRIEYKKPDQSIIKQILRKDKTVAWFKQRGINEKTLERFLIFNKEEWMPQTGKAENCICFPYLRDTEVVNVKFRDAKKNFRMVKDAELIFYNINSMVGKKKVIITEGECFMPTAEVLTKSGWVSFADYNGEPVAQQDTNGSIAFVNPTAIVSKLYDGDMIEFVNKQKYYSCTTPGHNYVFLRNGKIVKRTASDMPRDAKYFIPRVSKHNGSGLILSDNQIRLCVAVSADFSIRKEGDIYGAFKKERKKIRICEILSELEIPYSCNIDKRGYYSVFIKRGDAPSYLFKKFPHKWISASSQRQKELIIDEILFWDGNSVPNRKQIEYSSALYENATFIQTIATLCGYCSTIIHRSNEFGNWFKVSILFEKKHTTPLGLIKNKFHYSGMVHCVQVPSGVLLIRQNGCISVIGNCDAMAVYQAGFGQNLNPVQNPDKEGEVIETADPLSEYGVVSVPNGAALGANKKLEYLDNCADWFVGLDEIIIATDGDAAGMDLRDELIRRLGVERCKYVIYPKDASVSDSKGGTRPPKDMNEVLVWLGAEKVVELALNAFQVPVDGIYYVDDIFESMFESFKAGIQLAPTTRMGTLDDYFRWKKGDQNCWTGYANYGKTTYVLQLMLTKSIFDHWRWAIYSPENYPANDFYDDLIEMYCGKDLSQMTQEEYVDAATFINEHFFYVYPDHEHDLNAIHEKFRYLILKKGVDGVLVDPWNQLDHNMSGYQREDIYLSRAFKDTKRFALMNHIVYNIIAHPKNPTPRQDGSIDAADMYDLSGGSMWGNKMDGIISYHRPDHHADKSSTRCELHIQKVKRKRTGGKQGVVEYNHIWSRRRFEDTLTGKIYCDPNMVGKMPQLPQGELNLEKQYTPLSMEGF